MILKFRVYEQTISLQSTKAEPRQGSRDYLELQFSFSSDWNDLLKYVYIQHGEVSVPHDLAEGSVIVDEYFTEQTEFNVTLFGRSSDGSVEVPTNVVTVFLKESNNLWEKDAPEPQNSWIVQVVDARDEALAAAIRAENAAIRQPYPDEKTGTWWVWNAEADAYQDTGISYGGSGGGTNDHSKLINRNAADQHTIGAITGLEAALAGKQPTGDYLTREADPTVPAWAKQPQKPTYTAAEVGALPDTYAPPVDASLSETSTNPVQNKVVAAKLSEVESIAKGRATGHVFETETDMRTWIAANASALNLGDNLYIRATDVPDYWWDGTSAQPMETQKVDLTEYAKKSEVPAVDTTLTQSGQAADAAKVGEELRSLSEEIVTTSESKVSAHNTGADAHGDIRLLIQGLTDRLNTLADSDDTTLDQLSEVVSYIKSNRELISAITTDKVSVADIVDNLTTNVSNKPLSAAQGVALKALINAITVPDALPNPHPLTFTGAVTGSYDGSEPLTVNIPSGGGSANRKWSLIKTLNVSTDVALEYFDTDDEGNSFSVQEIFITGTMPDIGTGYLYCRPSIASNVGNTQLWATKGKYFKWYIGIYNNLLKTTLAISNDVIAGSQDKNVSCPERITGLAIGSSTGYNEAGTIYVYGR